MSVAEEHQSGQKKRKRPMGGANPPQAVQVVDDLSSDRLSQLRAKIPLVTLLSTMEATNKMNSTELRLRRWFKCTKFEDKCFATRNSSQQFLSHLADKHPEQTLFCLYCNAINAHDNKQYYPHEELVEHIRTTHCHRQYQCNLCLYRAISVDHILIHQQSVHSRNFEATLLKAEINGDQESDKMTNGQSIRECKVLECTPLAESPLPDADHYFQEYRHQQLNAELKANQCVYCPYMDANRDELYAHCVAAHPDYPILIYPGINPRHSTNGHNHDETEIVEKSAKKRNFDESFSESDVTTNGVVDTYEFDIWTESEDEDMLLSEDDLSLNANIAPVETGEPVAKKQKTEEPETGATEQEIRRRSRLQQTPLYLAACVSAALAVYFSVVVMSSR